MCAAYLHGRAAEIWSASTRADRGLLAHEVADRIPEAIAALAV
jgi:NAD(P)H-hydrate repair Nnr-like enzyme with NAD(P)H-hydrate dehydratase domain